MRCCRLLPASPNRAGPSIAAAAARRAGSEFLSAIRRYRSLPCRVAPRFTAPHRDRLHHRHDVTRRSIAAGDARGWRRDRLRRYARLRRFADGSRDFGMTRRRRRTASATPLLALCCGAFSAARRGGCCWLDARRRLRCRSVEISPPFAVDRPLRPSTRQASMARRLIT